MTQKRREELAARILVDDYAADANATCFKQAYDAVNAIEADIAAGSKTAGDDQILIQIGGMSYAISLMSVEAIDALQDMLYRIMEYSAGELLGV